MTTLVLSFGRLNAFKGCTRLRHTLDTNGIVCVVHEKDADHDALVLYRNL